MEVDVNFEDRCINLLKAQGYSDIKRMNSITDTRAAEFKAMLENVDLID